MGTAGRLILRRWAALAGVAAVATAGVATYLTSPAHDLHDPNHALQQLDLLYLDEPAPGLDRLGVEPGRPAVVVFCPDACPLPDLEDAQVVRSTDAELAEQYALRTAGGRVGPGYALVDASGRLRYRTFDPGLAVHEPEIRTLVAGLL
jgi:hypothetical protein